MNTLLRICPALPSPRGLLSSAALLLLTAGAFAQTDQTPPTAVIVSDDFEPIHETWQTVGGSWSVRNGLYFSNADSGMSVITSYRGVHPADPPTMTLPFKQFTLRARMRNWGASASDEVGLVYQYQDAANFYEVVLGPWSTASIRTVVNGVGTLTASGSFGGRRGQWFDLEVQWNDGKTTIVVDGDVVLENIEQAEFDTGQVGLTAHGVAAPFENVFVGVPFGDQPFREDFIDGVAPGWTPVSGQWQIANGVYANASTQQTNLSLVPIHTDLQQTVMFTLRARMLNPYGAAGNLVGIVFNYISSGGHTTYNEVVFAPTGVARINRVTDKVVQTLATAAYSGASNRWFDVKFEMDFSATVTVDGVKLFDRVDTNPNQYPQGGVGLITHWAPGQFDDVWFEHGVFQPFAQQFSDGVPASAVVVGSWNATDGVLRNDAVTATDLVALDATGTDFKYRVNVLNQYGGPGNLVGLIYSYQDSGLNAGDYYEVVFSPAGPDQPTGRGRVYLRKCIQGVLYEHSGGGTGQIIPRNEWFKLEITRRGFATTIRVNDRTVGDGRLNQLGPGRIGVVAHWAKGRFDNVKVLPLR